MGIIKVRYADRLVTLAENSLFQYAGLAWGGLARGVNPRFTQPDIKLYRFTFVRIVP